jgi:hypothetical protein
MFSNGFGILIFAFGYFAEIICFPTATSAASITTAATASDTAIFGVAVVRVIIRFRYVTCCSF